ncbi:MAG TPA: FeoA family protein, partial [Flavobacteriaceae bacterium]|nr:FeoA family protein [Flavobacteriaceae bacterium]
FDPHGDPIPNKDGEIQHHNNLMLSSLSEKNTGKVVGIKDSSNTFLQYLDQLQITLGSIITVNSIIPFDNTINITVNGKQFSISNQVAKNLFIQKT